MSNLITKIDSEPEKFELVKQAFEIMDSIGAYDNTKVRNALYTSLGTMAHTIKEDSLALTAFSLARENIESKFPNSEMLYTIYNNIGTIQRSLGDDNSALEYYNKALIIAQSKYKVDHPKIGWSYERIGGIFFFLKKYEESQSYLEKAYSILQPTYGVSHPKTQDLCKHMGASSYAINDWENVESYLSKVIPELQKSLRISQSDSTQHDQISKELELYLSVIIKAVEKLDKVDEKIGYMHQLYDIKCVISKPDISMFNISNELGKYYYEREEYFEAKNYFVEAYKTLRLIEDTSYRRNSICNNLYYTYMELFKREEVSKYKNEYISHFWPSIDIVLTIDEGETPASPLGMQGRYHLLKFENWDYKSLNDIFEYNKSLIGCPKHITVEKDGTISSYYFEDKIGANIEIKYMDSIERSNILNKYETLKGIDYEIF